jgi:Right handed beta helix region
MPGTGSSTSTCWACAATNTSITVADNTLDHTVSAEGRFGIEISRSSDVSVRGNLILDTRYDGIGFTTRDQPVPSSDVTISQNTIARSGEAAILVRDHAYSGPMTVRYNRIVDSGSGDGLVNDAPGATIDARLNWWGCNHMPAGAGCDHLAGTRGRADQFRALAGPVDPVGARRHPGRAARHDHRQPGARISRRHTGRSFLQARSCHLHGRTRQGHARPGDD